MAQAFSSNRSTFPSTRTSIRYNLSGSAAMIARLAWTCVALISLHGRTGSAGQVHPHPHPGQSVHQSAPTTPPAEYQVPGGAKVYCEDEKFNVSCSRSEVIVINWALYGRIRENKCFNFEDEDRYAINVVPDIEMKCSGKEHCIFEIYSMKGKYERCDRLRCYLEVQYSCIPVAGPPTCDVINATQSGSLASADYKAALERSSSPGPPGSTQCPWIIHAPPHQWINLTLEDFSYGNVRDCVEYGHIHDIKSDSRNKVICGGSSKHVWNYTSFSNTVNVTLKREKLNRRFLIRYSVVGCSKDIAVKDSWIEEIDRLSVKVHCNFTDELWQLKCIGTEWIGTDLNRICSVPASTVSPIDRVKEMEPYSMWILVSLGVVIGVVLGVVLLIGILCFMKRGKTNRQFDCSTHPAVISDHALKSCHASCVSLSQLDGSVAYSCKTSLNTPKVAFDDYDAWKWHQSRQLPDPYAPGDECGMSCISTIRRPSDCAESILSNSVAGSTLYRPTHFPYRYGEGPFIAVSPCGSCATTNRNYSPQHSDRHYKQFHSPVSDRHRTRTLERSLGSASQYPTNPMQDRTLPPVPRGNSVNEEGIYAMTEDEVSLQSPGDRFYFQLDPNLTKHEADHSQPNDMIDCKACSQKSLN